MKHLVEKCVEYGKSVQNKETGFIHVKERIPLLENLCFALGLLRKHHREGLDLVRKLLHFRDPKTGLFPRFIDQYPTPCRYNLLKLPLVHIQKFISIPECTFTPHTEIEKHLVASEIPEIEWGIPETYRGRKPEPTLFNLIMGEEFPLHPIHIFGSLIYATGSCPKTPYIPWGVEKEAVYIFREGKIESNTFSIDDTLQLGSTTLTFKIVQGAGKVFGHIGFGNRPNQLLDDQAYDWRVSLRVLKKSPDLVIECRAVDGDAHGVHAIVDVERDPSYC